MGFISKAFQKLMPKIKFLDISGTITTEITLVIPLKVMGKFAYPIQEYLVLSAVQIRIGDGRISSPCNSISCLELVTLMPAPESNNASNSWSNMLTLM